MLKVLRLIYFPLAVLFTAAFVLPVFFIRPFNPKNTSLFFRVFAIVTLKPMGFSYTEYDRHNMANNRPSILAGNHQHNFDTIVAAKAFFEHVVFLGKKEILYVPFMGLCFYFGGNVFIDRKNKKRALKSLNNVKKKLTEYKLSVVIFPEGTRNPERGLLPFKKGAFHTAIQTQMPIVPFAVSHYVQEMDLNKWRSAHIKVRYLEPIPTEGLTLASMSDVMEKTRNSILKALEDFDQNM
ncbi:MAG: 1-acyl-sn-glycerol-3-phosphate acyltransferase [Bacteriovoracaceae bacterium]|nr:1-acyl-sn-glycerol-3-phosphate acyltransferase [Bacteriovoracaceae bacterium]